MANSSPATSGNPDNSGPATNPAVCTASDPAHWPALKAAKAGPALARLVGDHPKVASVAVQCLINLSADSEFQEQMLQETAEDEALHMGFFVMERLSDPSATFAYGAITEQDQDLINVVAETGNVYRYNFFNADGIIVVASRPGDLGRRKTDSFFFDVVRQGQTYVEFDENVDFHPDDIVVEIADRGPGIPAEKREQVFTPFYRLEESRSRETGGPGWALPWCAASRAGMAATSCWRTGRAAASSPGSSCRGALPDP